MIFTLAILPFLAWAYLLVFHGRFWRSTPVLPSRVTSGAASVTVVVPARDEADSIQAALASLLAQDYRGALSIVMVDDNSSDGTAELAAALTSSGRLSIVNGEPLAAGWTGKLWAVQQGLAHPTAQAADYVLLTDADILHAPGHVAALVAHAEASGLELVSEMVRLRCEAPAERALIPAFIFFFQMLYPFDWVNDLGKRTAGAAGGTMLVARAALDRIDGVTRVRQNLIDDCALAKEIKRSGGRIWLGHAEDAWSMRAYPHWRDVWNMIARTAYVQLGYSPLLLLGCVAGMGLVFCAAPLLAIFVHGVPRVLGAVAWLMSAAAFQPTLRRYGCSPLWGLALPAIALFYLGATVASAVRHYAGRGGGWKERVYPPTSAS